MRRATPLTSVLVALAVAACACRPVATGAPAPVAPPVLGAAAAPAAADEGPDADAAALPREVLVAHPRPWSVIVLHHSASAQGGAARFDGWHRRRGWDGVGYDFVIGNGTDTPDGALETTFRWTQQRPGAHVKGWNDIAIGICLVGDFEDSDPTAAQVETLERLLRHLRRRFHVPAERVVGHGALGATACPGRRFPLRAVVDASDPDVPPARRS